MALTLHQLFLSFSHACLLIFLTLSSSLSFSFAISPDGQALLAFLQTVKGDTSSLQDWNPLDLSPCSWTGISCSSSAGRVVNISLSSLHLQGSIPSEVGSLTALQNLVLPSTNLTGSIPKELGDCSRLETLDLSGNNLTGIIPPSLGKLRHLKDLKLEGNELGGKIPAELGNCSSVRIVTVHDNRLSGVLPPALGYLQNLEVFRAGGNELLTGSIPSEIAKCKKLITLGLAATGISGFIPPELGELSNLTTLSLYQANLSGIIPPELGNCTHLRYLYLYGNYLTGPIPRELGNLHELSSLLLWQNYLDGSIPSEIGKLENLQQLDISQNYFTGNIPSSFGNLTLLQDLYLSVNYLSGSIPRELGNCSNLVDLQLDRNKLSGVIPQELGSLVHLSQIFLWNNSVEGAIPSSLGNCSGLQSLDFSSNQLSGDLPIEIFYLRSLEKLLLLSNNLSGRLPPEIGHCRGLIRLRLSKNQLTGVLPQELWQLQQLNFVDISDNKFTGILPKQIGQCTALQLLDVHHNLLSGSLPKELGLLNNLHVLDASYNNLTGSIPSDIGNLSLLNKLALQGNLLSGNIPGELSGCRKLELLDLSRNLLSGTLPSPLGRISSLSILLNLSWNKLTGPLPQEFSGLTNLGTLDLSHNNLSGGLAVIGYLGHLVTLNISFNQFSGPFPDTYFFRTLPSSDFQGNLLLCSTSNMTSCFVKHYGLKRHRFQNWTVLLFGLASVILAICLVLYKVFSSKNSQASMEGIQIAWPWQLMSFQKLNFSVDDILEKLVDANVIGNGCSGVVYKAEMPGGEVIAVKKMLSSYKGGGCNRDAFSAEVKTLGTIRHRNIVRLLGYCSNHEKKLLMYDYMPNGSLGEVLHEKRGNLDWETRYKILVGSAQGLAYLHHDCRPSILHRDVKANNILLGLRFEPYLADFGLAKAVSSPGRATHTIVAGSYGYIAPEYGYTLTITDKSDVYSFGVVLLEVLTGKRPIDPSLGEGRHLIDWVRERQKRHHDLSEILDPRLQGMADPYIHEMLQVLGIALDCVHPLPEERPTMRHVVSLLVGIKQEVEEYAKIDALLEKSSKKGNSPQHYEALPKYSFSYNP